MKGNVFSQWLKEFCALVFTQTVQAFILAIILTLVVMSLVSQNSSGYTNVTSNQAAGVLAIIALTSISKMESLIKKLFGLESSITDASMKGGKGGVLGSIAAMKMAKKVLDNGPKVATGIKNFRSANKQLKMADLDRANKEVKLRRRFVENYGTSALEGNNAQLTSGTESGGVAVASGNTSSINTSTLTANNPISNTNSSTSPTNKSISAKDRHKFEDDLEKIGKDYKDELEKIKKQRRDSIRSIASGLTESVGSVYGGITGALVGVATDDDILKNAGIGMGVGDTIGKKMIDIPGDAYEARIETKKLKQKYSSYKSNLKQANQELERLNEQMRSFNAGDI